MKRCAIFLMMSLLFSSFEGCSAEDVNNAINSAASSANVDINVNIEQEQIDTVKEGLNEAAEKVTEIAGDDDVQSALLDLYNALKDAAYSEGK